MTGRARRYEISRPQPIQHDPAPPPPLPAPAPAPAPAPFTPQPSENIDHAAAEPMLWSNGLPRPLSDIRELSEPSLMDNFMRNPGRHQRNASKASSMQRKGSTKREAIRHEDPLKTKSPETAPIPKVIQPQKDASSDYSSTPEQLSFFSIPQSSVPRRSSSFQRQARSHSRKPSIRSQPSSNLAPPIRPSFSIPNRGTSQSPVKEARLRLDPVTSDAARRIPSRTHVRIPHPTEILEYPSYKHPRLKLELQVSAPLFVGGGSVEGYVKVTVDDNERARQKRSLSIGAISVDLLGFEQVDSSRKATFLALGTELIDADHPPPTGMVQSPSPFFADEKFWSLMPSCSALPFMISLPLDTGPPPFHSKHASIRFVLSVTALVRDSGKHYRVRTSQDVHVLPTYDPEKALTSLSSPLTASDERRIARAAGQETLRVTAGLHRQVWVSGSSIFVDVHILNQYRKPVRKLELSLERDILCYKHAAASTLEKSAGQARIFESNERAILVRSSYKTGSAGWNGVEPHTADIRTCELELPRGHGTVRCGKYFEVRYFLNVIAATGNSKAVSVQLPIILIHMNSLDVVPNSVAQVAAAIEEKRAHRRLNHSRSRRQENGHSRQHRSFSSPAPTLDLKRQPSYAQGRAFAAPRQQSLDRQREQRADMDELRGILDSSPRKHAKTFAQGAPVWKTASHTSLATLAFPNRSTESLGMLGAMSYGAPGSMDVGQEEHGHVRGLNGRLLRIESTDSMRSKKPSFPLRSRKDEQNERRRMGKAGVQAQIGPYSLGLSTTTPRVSMDGLSERSGIATSFRDKLDRSRVEFQAVRKKASGGLKECWLESRRNGDDEKERDERERERKNNPHSEVKCQYEDVNIGAGSVRFTHAHIPIRLHAVIRLSLVQERVEVVKHVQHHFTLRKSGPGLGLADSGVGVSSQYFMHDGMKVKRISESDIRYTV
ncbi:hypothetical protein AC578_491 [Pseudocercospora eumusae]|uniref:Arrestin C-terminal-like domain-containing protein n=1 Tax=Pseudocercospora eumusae TaxID=321146 RepID=A0A139HY08_9PEZI|nr:hypothetical protein AC578_491 [Pseudocercospora eumusae]